MKRRILIPTNEHKTADEIIAEAFGSPKQEEPKIELQKVDTAKFVFAWENSTSVMEVAIKMREHSCVGAPLADITLIRKTAEVIRTVEKIPLRELPDKRPAVKRRGRIQNFS